MVRHPLIGTAHSAACDNGGSIGCPRKNAAILRLLRCLQPDVYLYNWSDVESIKLSMLRKNSKRISSPCYCVMQYNCVMSVNRFGVFIVLPLNTCSFVVGLSLRCNNNYVSNEVTLKVFLTRFLLAFLWMFSNCK